MKFCNFIVYTCPRHLGLFSLIMCSNFHNPLFMCDRECIWHTSEYIISSLCTHTHHSEDTEWACSVHYNDCRLVMCTVNQLTADMVNRFANYPVGQPEMANTGIKTHTHRIGKASGVFGRLANIWNLARHLSKLT